MIYLAFTFIVPSSLLFKDVSTLCKSESKDTFTLENCKDSGASENIEKSFLKMFFRIEIFSLQRPNFLLFLFGTSNVGTKRREFK